MTDADRLRRENEALRKRVHLLEQQLEDLTSGIGPDPEQLPWTLTMPHPQGTLS